MQQLRRPAFLVAGLLYLATAYFLWWLLPVLPRRTWPWNPTWQHPKHWAARNIIITTQFTPQGKTIGPIVFREATTGRVVKTLLSAEQEVGPPFEVSPGGRWLAWHDHKVFHVIDLSTDKKVAELPHGPRYGHTCFFSPDETTLAYPYTERAAPSPRNALVVWDLIAGKEKYRLPGESVPAAFSPDGKLLATGTPFHAADWPKPLPPAEVKLWDATTGQRLATLSGNGVMVGALRFTPDSRSLIVAGGVGQQLPAEDTNTFCRVWHFAEGHATPLKRDTGFLAPDGGLTTLREYENDSTCQRSCITWDKATGRELRRVDFDGMPDDAYYGALVASPEGLYAAVFQDRNAPLPVWRQWLGTRFGWVLPQGRRYEVHLADMQTGQRAEPLFLSSQDPQHCMCETYFTPDGRSFITIDPDKVSVWDLPLARPWAHILGWPLLPAALWLLWRWQRAQRDKPLTPTRV